MTTGLRDRRFAAVLGVWVLVAVVFWLGITRALEVLPEAVVSIAWVCVFLAAPLVLFVAAAWRAVRKEGTWPSAAAVPLTAVALIVAGIPLFQASIYLNFWAHRPGYDAAVAAAKAAGSPAGAIAFDWNAGMGVTYDEANCPAKAAPPTKQPDEFRPAMKPGGFMPLSGHYCFVGEPGL